VRRKGKGTKLEVFSDRAARANAAIFSVLAKESPQTIKQILKKISKYEGLEETYYASLTKRLHNLQETGYVREIIIADGKLKGQKSYELRIKAYLVMFLKENSIQDIINQAADAQAANILLALLNVLSPERDER
jgi:hypothetical protein